MQDIKGGWRIAQEWAPNCSPLSGMEPHPLACADSDATVYLLEAYSGLEVMNEALS